MKNILIILIFFCALTFAATPVVNRGSLKGLVLDADTKEPLSGVNILVDGTKYGAESDENGNFFISSIPVGSYNISYKMMGYKDVVKTGVFIKSEKAVYKNAEMNSSEMVLNEVSVSGAYFEEAKSSVVSSRKLDSQEIMSTAGGQMDVQRAVQVLPSVVSQTDQDNEVIVRGGNPGENLFIFDGIEVDNINHYGNQQNGGGPITNYHNEFIDQLDFSAGGFSAKYGEKCSSVMDITQREGSDKFEGNVNLGMAGLGGIVEGPLPNNKGSYILSYKKSYLDLIAGSVGLSAIPYYWSGQTKVTYNINEMNKLSFSTLFGAENIDFKEEDSYSRGAEKVYNEGNRIIGGLSWQRLFGAVGYNKFTIYGSRFNYETDVKKDFVNGASKTEKQQYLQDDQETTLAAKNETVLKLPHDIELSFGGQVKHIKVDYNAFAPKDTLYYWKPSSFNPDSAEYDSINTLQGYNGIRRAYEKDYNNKAADDAQKYGGFVEFLLPYNKFSARIGGRADYFSKSDELTLSPRFSLSYNLEPVTFKIAYGRYFQNPSLSLFYNEFSKNLKAYYNDQVVFGADILLSESVKLTAETYYKGYQNLPEKVYRTFINPLNNVKMVDYEYQNKSEGYSYGFELFLQKKLTDTYYSTLSYSYSQSYKYKDILDLDYNIIEKNKKLAADFDFGQTATITLGAKYRLSQYDWYLNYWYDKWYSYPFGCIGEETEVSIKSRYIGGKPFTPQEYNRNTHEWNDVTSKENSVRYPFYQRTDLRVDGRHFFGKINLVVYFEFDNLENAFFNRINVWHTNYSDYGRTEDVSQFNSMFVGGFALEF